MGPRRRGPRRIRNSSTKSGAGMRPMERSRSMAKIRREGGDKIARVLEFWLDEVGPEGWYAIDEAIDRRCAEEFGELMEEARLGRLIQWRAGAGGAQALPALYGALSSHVLRRRA